MSSQLVYLDIQELVTGKNNDRKDFLSLWSQKIVQFDKRYWINIIYYYIASNGIKGM